MRMLPRLLIAVALLALVVVVPAAQAANVHLFTRLAGVLRSRMPPGTRTTSARRLTAPST